MFAVSPNTIFKLPPPDWVVSDMRAVCMFLTCWEAVAGIVFSPAPSCDRSMASAGWARILRAREIADSVPPAP